MTVYHCPDCGELLMINGRCWVCGYCGAEACGLGSLKAEPNTGRATRLNERSETSETRTGVHSESKAGGS